MNRGREPDPEYEFYRKYRCSLREAIDFLSPVALRLTKKRHDAEDLVYSLLEKLITSPAPTEPVRLWKPFLKAALVKLYIDKFIRTKEPIPLDIIPEDSRFCYFTFSIQRTHSEIATELGVPVGTVARRLHDALRILRRRLSGGTESGQGHGH